MGGDGALARADSDRCVSVRRRRRQVHDNGPAGEGGPKVGRRWAGLEGKKERREERESWVSAQFLFFFSVLTIFPFPETIRKRESKEGK